MTQTILADKQQVHSEEAVLPDRRAAGPTAFTNVLVGVDGTSAGRDAMALGETLRTPDGRLTLAHVVLTQGPIYRKFHSTPVGKRSHEMLERERAAAGVAADVSGMFAASVGSGLRQLAEDVHADLLVVGSCRRRAVRRLLRGDATGGSLSGAACAVAVAPAGYANRHNRIDTIGIAYNGSPEAKTPLAAGLRLADRYGATLRALTVVWPTTAVVWPAGLAPPGGPWAAMTFETFEREASERLRSLIGVDARVAVGPPDDELLAFGNQVDLLVVGSRGHGPLRRLLFGSTSAHLARSARCPVLVLPRRFRAR